MIKFLNEKNSTKTFLHWKGFSGRCRFICFDNDELSWKALVQTLHTCGFSPTKTMKFNKRLSVGEFEFAFTCVYSHVKLKT